LYVHVAGAVHHPGLYQLLPGARVFHAVEAAGGTTPEAHPDAVNLAAPLSDGQRVYIPTRAETAEPDHTWSAKVNINRADQARLESLPGIGPALALEIISYRNRQGPFKSIEELTNISGIGQRTLERLRPLVTID
jgi:competence protein ComEA